DRRQIPDRRDDRLAAGWTDIGLTGDHDWPSPAPQLAMIVFSDSRSALLMRSQRSQASGSISSWMDSVTISRRSLGSIASSSQHWSPWFSTNHRKRGSLRLSVTGNDGKPVTWYCVSAMRLTSM